MTEASKWLIDSAPRFAPPFPYDPPVVSPAPNRFFTLRSTTGSTATAFQYPIAPDRGDAGSAEHFVVVVSDGALSPADRDALADYLASLDATAAWLVVPRDADGAAPAQADGGEREPTSAPALSAEFVAGHRLEPLPAFAAALAHGPTRVGERAENLKARARWFSKRTQKRQ